jgi:hypothetical protein
MIRVDVDGQVWGIGFRYDTHKGDRLTITECVLMYSYDDTRVERFWGRAYCCEQDRFEKETGRKIALTRALKMGEFTRETRRLFWDAYLDR